MGVNAPRDEHQTVSPPVAWAALMARAQAGERDPYRALLIAVTPYIRAMASNALRGRVDVEDAVQDILLTMHRVRHTYDPTRPFRPWLAGIARHRLQDRLRAIGRRAAWEVAWEPVHETFAADPAKTEDGIWHGPALQTALASLPAGQRQAIEMTKLREMSVREASTASGMTEGAIKVAVHRGLARLRRLLAGGAGA